MRKTLHILGFCAWLIGFGSWFPLAYVETEALGRPGQPTAKYIAPLRVKGVVRYVTPTEAQIDQIAKITFAGGLVLFILVVLRSRRDAHKSIQQTPRRR